MIGFLRGVLARKGPPFLLIDVGGIGYEVEAPMSTCFRLPATGEKVQLCTHLLIREDHHTLFGFSTEVERRLFRDLLRVSGVGAKTALGVLSGLSVEAFIRCVETDDVASLVRLPGIGRKTAERFGWNGGRGADGLVGLHGQRGVPMGGVLPAAQCRAPRSLAHRRGR